MILTPENADWIMQRIAGWQSKTQLHCLLWKQFVVNTCMCHDIATICTEEPFSPAGRMVRELQIVTNIFSWNHNNGLALISTQGLWNNVPAPLLMKLPSQGTPCKASSHLTTEDALFICGIRTILPVMEKGSIEHTSQTIYKNCEC